MTKLITIAIVAPFLLSGPPSPAVPTALSVQNRVPAGDEEVTQEKWEDLLGFSRTERLVRDLEGMLLYVNGQQQHQRGQPRTTEEASARESRGPR